MEKRLQDLSLYELWELFPIFLSPHDSRWKDWAREEITLLTGLLAGYSPKILHIGSTAINDIMAKPIIDILIELPLWDTWPEAKQIMESNGYICMAVSKDRMSFNKGYTPTGYAEKTFHIHFHQSGDDDEVLFRDYLNSHPELAIDYERLKKSLLPKFKYNRDGYTEAKTSFVKYIMTLAKGK